MLNDHFESKLHNQSKTADIESHLVEQNGLWRQKRVMAIWSEALTYLRHAGSDEAQGNTKLKKSAELRVRIASVHSSLIWTERNLPGGTGNLVC